MIPLLAAVPVAASVVNGVFSTINRAIHPPQTSGSADFSAQLARQMQSGNPTASTAPSAQSLIATQLSRGSLPLDQQIQLGQQVMNQTVQLVDSGGNSRTGLVTGMNIQNGAVYLTVGGQNSPITALRSVLRGITP